MRNKVNDEEEMRRKKTLRNLACRMDNAIEELRSMNNLPSDPISVVLMVMRLAVSRASRESFNPPTSPRYRSRLLADILKVSLADFLNFHFRRFSNFIFRRFFSEWINMCFSFED